MASVNKVILVGRLGRDPDIRETKKGDTQASFTLATDNGYGDNKKTDWHNVICYGKPADFVQKYIQKGASLYVEGTINYRQYEDQDGNQRKVTDIKAFSVQALGSKQSTSSPPQEEGKDIPF
jgi:single-strand DNA-binding protein